MSMGVKLTRERRAFLGGRLFDVHMSRNVYMPFAGLYLMHDMRSERGLPGDHSTSRF